MAPYPPDAQPWRTRLGPWAGSRLGGLGVALALVGCQAAGGETKRTEPWLKDDVALSRTQREVLHYRAERGQFLTFIVSGKAGPSKHGASTPSLPSAISGRIPLSGATLSLDPMALDHSRGELRFDVGGLSIEAAEPGLGEGAAYSEDPILTGAARAWLNLGSEVPESARALAQSALFGIRFGRELSSHSIQGGRVMAAAARGELTTVRRVSGVLEGDLLLLGREVTHVLKVEVDFVSGADDAAKGMPDSLVVRLSLPEPVPLLEHGIQPKDERGATIAGQVAALGRRSNLRAAVSGSLSFVRSAD